MHNTSGLHSTEINKALVFSASAHQEQLRKGTYIPYIIHPYAVGMILARCGCTGNLADIEFGYLPALVQTTRAAITPGTHPHNVNSETINIVPQPISNTAKGGSRMQIKALPKPIILTPPCLRPTVPHIGDGPLPGHAVAQAFEQQNGLAPYPENDR